MKTHPYILLLLFLFIVIDLRAQNLPEGFSASIIAEELNPVDMTFDHHGRIWLVQKDGRVLIIDEDEALLPNPFIEIEVDDFNERGLLGIALHPDMDNHPYVYLYYTVKDENHNRLSRFRANGDHAVPGSEEILLELDKLDGTVHNGGALVFDNEGYLYVATGESGLSGNSQDKNNLLGKILRLHDDGSIPETNPFYDEFEGKNRAIWCMGLRNPFNMSYDARLDILYATDVGGGKYEEINVIEAGKNYGWPSVEGPLMDQEPPENYKDPFYFYDHDNGCAIVGLAVYHSDNPLIDSTYQNGLFFADYCAGYIKFLKNAHADSLQLFATELERPLHLLVNHENGNLYFLTRAGIGGGSTDDNTSTDEGRLWKLFYTGNGIPSVVLQPQDLTVPVNENATFQLSAVGSDTLKYNWYVNDSLVASSDSSFFTIPNVGLSNNGDSIYCIVTNREGSDTSHIALLTVLNDHRPEAQIVFPKPSFTYKAGDTIYFEGVVSDMETGLIDSSNYVWKITFHHDQHTHPFIERLDSVASGSFVYPLSGEPDTNTWVRIYLSATDPAGLRGSTFREIYPQISYLYLDGIDGFPLNIDGVFYTLPYNLPTITNLNRTIEMVQKRKLRDHLYLFSNWADNGSSARIRTVQAGTLIDTLRIEFDSIPLGNGTGLYAEYYNDEDRELDGEPDLIRIDSVLNFDWELGSPDTNIIDPEGFSARWRGFIEPLFSEDYELSVLSDDGFRLWLNDTLVMDYWMRQSEEEKRDTVYLSADKKHRLRVEYFEAGGGANIYLKWASENSQETVIPKRQMYPMTFGSISARVWHDKNEDGQIQEESEEYIPNASVFLFTENGYYVDHTNTNGDGFFRFGNYEVGEYYAIIVLPDEYSNLNPAYGFKSMNRTQSFTLKSDSLIENRYGFNGKLNTNDTIIADSKEIIVFPNPSHGQIQIVAENLKGFEEIKIFDSSMQEQSPSIIKWNSNTHAVIDMDHFAAGFYTLLFKDDSEVYKKGIVIIK